MPFFQQQVLDKIKEAEVDALFTHFLKECDLEGYNIAGDYWICVDRLKQEKTGYTHGGLTTKEFFEEVKKNTLLKNRFLNTSPAGILTSRFKLWRYLVARNLAQSILNSWNNIEI